ncbi:MAG: Rossmann fold nucleotide-binding protein [Lapillicoccus sp.]
MEIHDAAVLSDWLARGRPLTGLRLQDLDLTPVAAALVGATAATDVTGLVILGGTVPPALADHLRARGVMIFPADPDAPVDVFRAHLYTGAELYAGLDGPQGYAGTPDARAYRWSRDARLAHDAYATLLRAVHDDSISDALDEWVSGRQVVGVMGGHVADRGSEEYAVAARLGRELASAGLLVATGGGPGAMEAANLGALAPSESALADALGRLGSVRSFRPDVGDWVRMAFAVLDSFTAVGGAQAEPRPGIRGPQERPGLLDPAPQPRSLGIPTWFYGHEPPNVFANGIAKYFSNAIREDGLIARCRAGVVVLPGAAGTLQEVFQLVARLYYAAPDAHLPPLVLVGREQWTQTLPVAGLLTKLGVGRPMASAVHVVDGVEEAVAVIRAG